MKKLFALALVASFALAFTACGKKAEEATTEPAQTETPAAEPAPADTTAADTTAAQ
ncbi:MAG: hypothetical protein N2044_09840 [Cyclobacteriaceae bacterium]|nr:hypothetical protein [Cyclobacteriaceae bacterium]MCX7638131.1 hypothetical protein [Cyclobacteriaceae bacterium]MDW8330969.1 hypothetical protein [Cyclobacteriaceae bacterium]